MWASQQQTSMTTVPRNGAQKELMEAIRNDRKEPRQAGRKRRPSRTARNFINLMGKRPQGRDRGGPAQYSGGTLVLTNAESAGTMQRIPAGSPDFSSAEEGRSEAGRDPVQDRRRMPPGKRALLATATRLRRPLEKFRRLLEMIYRNGTFQSGWGGESDKRCASADSKEKLFRSPPHQTSSVDGLFSHY